MKKISWNLECTNKNELNIIQLSVERGNDDEKDKLIDKKLVLFSHVIAASGIPACCLHKSPEYIQHAINKPIILVFDLNSEINRIHIPDYIESKTEYWNLDMHLTGLIYDHFQRAYTLMKYYEMIKYRPIYMTTHLIFTEFDDWTSPFVLQHIPVKYGSTFAFRTHLMENLSIAIRENAKPTVNTYILIPPYESLFYIQRIDEEEIKCIYLNGEKYSFALNQLFYIDIIDPPTYLFKFYNQHPNLKSMLYSNSYLQGRYQPISVFENAIDEVRDFFLKIEKLNQANQNDQKTAIQELEEEFIELEPTCEELISEFSSNFSMNQFIIVTIKRYWNLTFDNRVPMECHANATFLSFNKFMTKIPGIVPSKMYYSLLNFSETGFISEFSIPSLLINRNGRVLSAPADIILKRWEQERFHPISGAKDSFLYFICEDTFTIEEAQDHMTNIQHYYNQLGLGKLKEYPKLDSLIIVKKDKIKASISSLLRFDRLIEHRRFPMIVVVLSDPITDQEFSPHVYIKYISPKQIRTRRENFYKAICFIMYSQIRLFNPEIKSGFTIKKTNFERLIYMYRYQPPYLLQQKDKTLSFQIAWDISQNITIWTDETGSILTLLDNVTSPIQIKETINKFEEIMKNDVRSTLTILGEGIPKDMYTQAKHDLPNTTILTVSPRPSIQIQDYEIDNDILIIGSNEQTCADTKIRYEIPILTGYYISKKFPAYMINLYYTPQTKDPKSALLRYAETMSNMSWLSIIPDKEERATVFPPHIAVLMQLGRNKINTFSLIEYQPYDGIY